MQHSCLLEHVRVAHNLGLVKLGQAGQQQLSSQCMNHLLLLPIAGMSLFTAHSLRPTIKGLPAMDRRIVVRLCLFALPTVSHDHCALG